MKFMIKSESGLALTRKGQRAFKCRRRKGRIHNPVASVLTIIKTKRVLIYMLAYRHNLLLDRRECTNRV